MVTKRQSATARAPRSTQQLEAVTKASADYRAKMAPILARPYDGIHGTVPDWLPDFFKRLFASCRADLIERGASVEQIATWIDDARAGYMRQGMRGKARYPREYALAIECLGWIKDGVVNGRDRGLRYLIGREGGAIMKARADHHKEGGEEIARRAAEVNRPIFEAAARLHAQEQHQSKGPSQLAMLIERQGIAPGRSRNAITLVLRRYPNSWS